MTIDAHAHVTEGEYGSVDLLITVLGKAKIEKAVIVPGGMLDVRKMTGYITGKEKPETLEVPNSVVEDAIERYPDKFYGFVCVDPHKGEESIETLDDYFHRGFVGLKLAPLVHQFSFNNKTVLALAERCGEIDFPFYTHVVYNPAASTTKLGLLVKEFPKTKFILGHMGFGPADEEAIDLAYQYENLFLETSGGSFLIIKEALSKVGPTKIIFGSEFPMYHPLAELEKINLLQCTGMEKILGENILSLIRR